MFVPGEIALICVFLFTPEIILVLKLPGRSRQDHWYRKRS
jgi:hypothetical protein